MMSAKKYKKKLYDPPNTWQCFWKRINEKAVFAERVEQQLYQLEYGFAIRQDAKEVNGICRAYRDFHQKALKKFGKRLERKGYVVHFISTCDDGLELHWRLP